jgi:hypothetical protein
MIDAMKFFLFIKKPFVYMIPIAEIQREWRSIMFLKL